MHHIVKTLQHLILKSAKNINGYIKVQIIRHMYIQFCLPIGANFGTERTQFERRVALQPILPLILPRALEWIEAARSHFFIRRSASVFFFSSLLCSRRKLIDSRHLGCAATTEEVMGIASPL